VLSSAIDRVSTYTTTTVETMAQSTSSYAEIVPSLTDRVALVIQLKQEESELLAILERQQDSDSAKYYKLHQFYRNRVIPWVEFEYGIPAAPTTAQVATSTLTHRHLNAAYIRKHFTLDKFRATTLEKLQQFARVLARLPPCPLFHTTNTTNTTINTVAATVATNTTTTTTLPRDLSTEQQPLAAAQCIPASKSNNKHQLLIWQRKRLHAREVSVASLPTTTNGSGSSCCNTVPAVSTQTISSVQGILARREHQWSKVEVDIEKELHCIEERGRKRREAEGLRRRAKRQRRQEQAAHMAQVHRALMELYKQEDGVKPFTATNSNGNSCDQRMCNDGDDDKNARIEENPKELFNAGDCDAGKSGKNLNPQLAAGLQSPNLTARVAAKMQQCLRKAGMQQAPSETSLLETVLQAAVEFYLHQQLKLLIATRQQRLVDWLRRKACHDNEDQNINLTEAFSNNNNNGTSDSAIELLCSQILHQPIQATAVTLQAKLPPEEYYHLDKKLRLFQPINAYDYHFVSEYEWCTSVSGKEQGTHIWYKIASRLGAVRVPLTVDAAASSLV
jgi:hypothetical protein